MSFVIVGIIISTTLPVLRKSARILFNFTPKGECVRKRVKQASKEGRKREMSGRGRWTGGMEGREGEWEEGSKEGRKEGRKGRGVRKRVKQVSKEGREEGRKGDMRSGRGKEGRILGGRKGRGPIHLTPPHTHPPLAPNTHAHAHTGLSTSRL
jgi:hypothetical protein